MCFIIDNASKERYAELNFNLDPTQHYVHHSKIVVFAFSTSDLPQLHIFIADEVEDGEIW